MSSSSARKAWPSYFRASVSAAHIRKAETGGPLGADLWKELRDLYVDRAAQLKVDIPAPPVRELEAKAMSGSESELAQAIREQTAAINALVAKLGGLVGPANGDADQTTVERLGELREAIRRPPSTAASSRRRRSSAGSRPSPDRLMCVTSRPPWPSTPRPTVSVDGSPASQTPPDRTRWP